MYLIMNSTCFKTVCEYGSYACGSNHFEYRDDFARVFLLSSPNCSEKPISNILLWKQIT